MPYRLALQADHNNIKKQYIIIISLYCLTVGQKSLFSFSIYRDCGPVLQKWVYSSSRHLFVGLPGSLFLPFGDPLRCGQIFMLRHASGMARSVPLWLSGCAASTRYLFYETKHKALNAVYTIYYGIQLKI